MPFFFFFNDTATTEIYPLSLHDALPILQGAATGHVQTVVEGDAVEGAAAAGEAQAIRHGDGAARNLTPLHTEHQIVAFAGYGVIDEKRAEGFTTPPACCINRPIVIHPIY